MINASLPLSAEKIPLVQEMTTVFPLRAFPPFLLEKGIVPYLDAPSLISLTCTCRAFRKLQLHRDASRQILSTAAKANYFALFRWAWNQGAPFLIKEKGALLADSMFDYIFNAVLKKHKTAPFLISHERNIQERFCFSFCTLAAKAGDWKLFEWGFNQGFPCSRDAFIDLICAGQLELLKNVSVYYPYSWNHATEALAGEPQYIQILQMAVEAEPLKALDVCALATKWGHLEVVEWALDQGYDWGETAVEAVKAGNLELLKWAHNKFCHLPSHLLSIAVEYNRDEIMEWLRKYAYPWERLSQDITHGGACLVAARKEDWPRLLWLLNQNVAWTEELPLLLSSRCIAHLMHLEILGIPIQLLISKKTFKEGEYVKVKWAVLTGFPLNRELYRLAFASKNPRLIAFLTPRIVFL